jgi:hypothetical protein
VKKILNIARLLCLTTIPVFGMAQAKDTLFFNNGGLLIGELKSISLGKVKFDDDVMDVVNIKGTQIKTLDASTHIFRIETINAEIFYSAIQSSTKGRIRVVVNGVEREISLSDIGNMVPLKGKTNALWQGNASVGYTYAKSTGIGQFNSSLNLEYITRKVDVLLSGSSIINQTDSTFQVDNATIGLYNSYSFTSLWEADVFFIYQRNLQQGLERRYQEGLGGGASFISTAHMRAKAITGIMLSQELSIEGVKSPTQVDIPALLNFNFFRFSKPDLTINLKEDAFFGITQKGRIRQDGQLNLLWKLFGDLSINLQFYHNYDNQPPGANSEKLDYGFVFGLSYKFSQ